MSTITLSPSFAYTIKRYKPELIPPAKPTPYEFKNLSDYDDQKSLRIHLRNILFYRNVGLVGRDPVKVIKEAISKALVYYYPFAGRLREGPNNDKLMVECTGEGVMFIEAEACVRLEQFGDIILPPIPGSEDLLYDVPGSDGILNTPLLLIQVTRLVCGGFTLGFRSNHTIIDALGLLQFMTALAEIARGASVPSVLPVWRRDFLNSREPPRVSCIHHAYDENRPLFLDNVGMPFENMTQFVSRSFYFGPQEIAGLRNQLPPHLCMCSKFEILSACLWRGRTIALCPNPSDKVGVACTVNTRAKFNPPLPVGYYGNAFGLAVAVSSAGKLCQNPLWYAVELVKNAIEQVTEEFMRSTIDLLAKNRQSNISAAWYYISDLTRMGFNNIDFGWGKAVYAGLAEVGPVGGFFIPLKNDKGEDGIAVTISLPGAAMVKFAKEIEQMIKDPNDRISSVNVSKL